VVRCADAEPGQSQRPPWRGLAFPAGLGCRVLVRRSAHARHQDVHRPMRLRAFLRSPVRSLESPPVGRPSWPRAAVSQTPQSLDLPAAFRFRQGATPMVWAPVHPRDPGAVKRLLTAERCRLSPLPTVGPRHSPSGASPNRVIRGDQPLHRPRARRARGGRHDSDHKTGSFCAPTEPAMTGGRILLRGASVPTCMD
jgi:hypothetical protein